MGALEGREWFPQTAGGKQRELRLRARDVEQNHIEVARKRKVLKAVVQHVYAGVKIPLADEAPAETIGGDYDGDVGQRLCERGGLVTDHPGIEDEAGLRVHDYGLFSSPAITACEDAGSMSACEQSLRYQNHQRCLSGSTYA